jgi:small subunit ribosomal protein S16
MKRLGRKHRPYYRLCVLDGKKRRDGRVLEEVGLYDPMIADTDARAVLNGERIDYWIGVGAQPSDKAAVLIKKYGSSGTHLEQQKAALDKMKAARGSYVPSESPPPPKVEEKKEEAPAAAEVATADDSPTADSPAEAKSNEG